MNFYYFGVLFLFFNCRICIEDRESFSIRYQYYRTNIEKFSHNTLTVSTNNNNDLYCKAKTDIMAGSTLMKIPKNMSLCSFNLFPFKYELVKFILEAIPKENEKIQSQKLSKYLLTFYLMYEAFANKTKMKDFILKRNLEDYYKVNLVEESIINFYPKILINNVVSLENDQVSFLEKNFGKLINYEEIIDVFDYVISQVIQTNYFEILMPWISKIENFKWAYGIVLSRSIEIDKELYFNIDDIKNKSRKFTKFEKKNLEINKSISNNFSTSFFCLVNLIDLCRFNPKNHDSTSRRNDDIIYENGSFIYLTKSVIKKGDPLESYNKHLDNFYLFLNYGKFIQKNKMNILKSSTELNMTYNKPQTDLCNEIGCLKFPDKENSDNSKLINIDFENFNLNQDLLNSARIRYLKGEFNYKTILQRLKNKLPISYQNEISAQLLYFSIQYKLLNEYEKKIIKLIYKSQNYRNKCKKLENDHILSNENLIKEWRNNKMFEIVVQVVLSFQVISTQHTLGTLNQVIFNTKNEIEKIKQVYMDLK